MLCQKSMINSMRIQVDLQIPGFRQSKIQTKCRKGMQKLTLQERKQRVELERKLYDTIIEYQGEPVELPIQQNKGILAVHFILKIMPLTLVVFDQVTGLLFQQQYTAQLVVLLIVIEFWTTKNFIGKRMVGYKWFFGEDPYGQERIMFQCRANNHLIDPTLPRLFWIVQWLYIIIAGLLFAQALLIIPNAVRIQSRKLQMNLLIIVSGMINIFFFYVVSDCTFLSYQACIQRQQSLRRQVGIDYVKKLQLGSIVGYYP